MTRPTLSRGMTRSEFDRGYWYAVELKAFARQAGIPGSASLRKDELETAIKHLLLTGKVGIPARRNLSRTGVKDVDRGLRPGLRVVLYTNDRETKEFLEREARRRSPGFRRKSGARYRLNRWREEQIVTGRRVTYRDLVDEYVRLNRPDTPFARVPTGRYINFLSDFLASEAGATHQRAILAWNQVKSLPVPKDYRSWKAHRTAKPGH